MNSNESAQQWIRNGPQGRRPTREDADQNGNVLVASETRSSFEKWDHVPGTNWRFWLPWPPLPKPVEKTRQEKDWAKYNDLNERDESSANDDVHDFANWARAEGRAQMAREALAIVEFEYPQKSLLNIGWSGSSELVYALHKLLTKAAEEKP